MKGYINKVLVICAALVGMMTNAYAQDEKIINPQISYAGTPQTVVIGGLTTSGVEGYDDYVLTEIYPDAVKMKKQMSYANAKHIDFVVLAGDNEIEAGKVTLKNMVTGEQNLVDVDEMIKQVLG